MTGTTLAPADSRVFTYEAAMKEDLPGLGRRVSWAKTPTIAKRTFGFKTSTRSFRAADFPVGKWSLRTIGVRLPIMGLSFLSSPIGKATE